MWLIAQVTIDPGGPAYAQVVESETEGGHGKVIAEKRVERKGRSDRELRDAAGDFAALMFETEEKKRRQGELF